MTYEDLTPQQKNEVHYLFSDEILKKSPVPYDYEINSAGDITGRKPLTVVNASRKGDDHNEAVIREDPHPTEEQIKRADTTIDYLAGRVIRALAIAMAESKIDHVE